MDNGIYPSYYVVRISEIKHEIEVGQLYVHVCLVFLFFIYFQILDIKLLEYRPSIISAAALLSAANGMFPTQLTCFRNSISSCEYVSEVNARQTIYKLLYCKIIFNLRSQGFCVK